MKELAHNHLSAEKADTELTKVKVPRSFILTGFTGKEKHKLISLIKSLKALHISSLISEGSLSLNNPGSPAKALKQSGDFNLADMLANYLENISTCTHVIAKKPCKSEKFLCACAAGKWLLTERYLYACYFSKKWLPEEGYQWGRQQCIDSATASLAMASTRWREILSASEGKPPFDKWTVGMVAGKSFGIFKRLIEVGGGKAVDLSANHQTELTHVIADTDQAQSVIDFHKRGIPCVRCEYLAQRILQDPLPCTDEFSLFPDCSVIHEKSDLMQTGSDASDGLSKMEIKGKVYFCPSQKVTVKKAVVDDQITATSMKCEGSSAETTPKCRSAVSKLLASDLKESNLKVSTSFALHCDVKVAGEESISQRDVLRHDDVTSEVQPSGVSPCTLDPSFAGSVVISENERNPNETKQEQIAEDCQVKLHSNTQSHSEIMQQTDQERQEAMSIISTRQDCTSELLAASDRITDPSFQVASSAKLHNTCEMTSHGRPVVASPSISSPDNTRPTELDWSSQKKALIRDALNEIGIEKKVGCAILKDPIPHQHNIRPHRFTSREMTMLENSVDVAHSHSVLITCRMLINKEKYPPPDLLFLIMKKYLLDGDCAQESRYSSQLLQSLLSFHPPSASHMQQDDIYSKAMSVTSATDSSLLTLSKLTLNDKVRLWNDVNRDFAERCFFKAVLKQAMGVLRGVTQRRRNAITLLSFMASLLEEHTNLLEKIFWAGSDVSLSRPIKSLLAKFRTILEADMKNNNIMDTDENANEKADDVESISESSDDDESDDGFEEMHLIGEISESLSKIVNCLINKNTSKRPDSVQIRRDVLAFGLAETFADADDVIIVSLRSLVKFPLQSVFFRMFLETNFSDRLAKVSPDEPLSLHTIVQRYLYFLPKPTNSKHNIDLTKPTSPSSRCVAMNGESPSKHEVKRFPISPGDPNFKLSSATINRRNLKGETPLHRACILNQPGRVMRMLAVPAVDPNARDHAGWTPLSEACNRGHVDCVKELLRLPLKSKASSNYDENTPPVLEIDLLACPEEGTTPLHDTLSNEHVEVAKMLIEKGGVELLYVTDKQGNSPLDVCATEEMRSIVLENALEVGSKICERTAKKSNPSEPAIPAYKLTEKQEYDEVLPCSSTSTSSGWLNSCKVYGLLLQSLLMAYISEKKLLKLLLKISRKTCDIKNDDFKCRWSVTDSIGATEEVCRIDSDIAYLLNWEDIERTFKEHLRIVSGDSFSSDYNCLSKDIRSIVVNLL